MSSSLGLTHHCNHKAVVRNGDLLASRPALHLAVYPLSQFNTINSCEHSYSRKTLCKEAHVGREASTLPMFQIEGHLLFISIFLSFLEERNGILAYSCYFIMMPGRLTGGDTARERGLVAFFFSFLSLTSFLLRDVNKHTPHFGNIAQVQVTGNLFPASILSHSGLCLH